jgi:L-ribulokinase
MKDAHFVIGVDFGTNSVRAVVVSCGDGSELGSSVFNYPSGDEGVITDRSDPNLARQNPADYVEGLEKSITGALKAAGVDPASVVGIGVDTTGSTPIPVDEANTPLGMKPEWRGNPAAMAWLWKDHTSAAEAAEITAKAAEHRPHFLAKCGSAYSSEWFWSKALHCLRTSPDVFRAAYNWIECADWVPSVLCGIKDARAVRRGVCAACHKAMYCEEWGGLPDAEFLAMLDPELAELRKRLFDKAHEADTPAGTLSADWAKRLGLKEGIPVAIGGIDAHYGAVGSGAAPGTLVKIMGTSTCDCTVSAAGQRLPDIPGICGIVQGSILPGCYGLEAGQSAVGDIFKWFVEKVCGGDSTLHAKLTEEASGLAPGQSGLIALDWNNGNRNVLTDPKLVGLLIGQTLHTTAAEIYRALIEATAFGARAILERLQEYGVSTARIVCCGGIAEKNPMLMQIYADVTGCVMEVAGSSQTCALGSAVSAAVAACVYPDFGEAQAAMVAPPKERYEPDAARQAAYDRLYGIYRKLHDAFGVRGTQSDVSGVMKELIAIRMEASRQAVGAQA